MGRAVTGASAPPARLPRPAALGPLLLMCLFGFGWAVVEDIFGAALQQRYDLLQVVWSRYAVHLTIVACVWGFRRPARLWQTRRPVFHLVRSMMMLIMPLSFAVALGRGSQPQFIWSVFWSAPLLVLGMAFLAQRQLPALTLWIGAILGWLGAILILAAGRPASLTEFVVPGIMGLSFAVYVAMTRSLRGENVSANMFYTAAGVFALLTVYVPRVWLWPTLHDWVLFLGIGGVGFVSLLALDRAVAHSPAEESAPALYVQVAFVAFVGMLMGGRGLTLQTFAGLTLVGAAVAAAARLRAGRAPHPSRARA